MSNAVWGFVAIILTATAVLAILYSKLRNAAIEAELKAEKEARLLAEAAFAEEQRKAKERDENEAKSIDNRSDAIGFLRDSLRNPDNHN